MSRSAVAGHGGGQPVGGWPFRSHPAVVNGPGACGGATDVAVDGRGGATDAPGSTGLTFEGASTVDVDAVPATVRDPTDDAADPATGPAAVGDVADAAS